MFAEKAIANYNHTLKESYAKLAEMSFAGKLSISLAMAFAIGILAQIRVFIPGTPVPMVLTQVGIISSAALMGKKWGLMPVGLYIFGGLLGVPWFSSFGSGVSYLLGPTGGYLIGFVLSALFIAHLANSPKVKGKVLPIFTVVAISQMIIIYVPGLLQLNLWFNAMGNGTLSFNQLLAMGFYPFLIGDIIKTVLGSSIVLGIGRR